MAEARLHLGCDTGGLIDFGLRCEALKAQWQERLADLPPDHALHRAERALSDFAEALIEAGLIVETFPMPSGEGIGLGVTPSPVTHRFVDLIEAIILAPDPAPDPAPAPAETGGA